jgi:hypothetical protein
MRVPGEIGSDDLAATERLAKNQFSEVLGVLRVMKFGRGELRSEIDRSVASDEHGNQVIRVGTAKAYVTFPGALEKFATGAATGITASPNLGDALRIAGKPNRQGSDYSIIYELAEEEFGGREGIKQSLDVSGNRQGEFTKSVNHLAPADGGRHAKGDPNRATMTLDEVSRFATSLVGAWIQTY